MGKIIRLKPRAYFLLVILLLFSLMTTQVLFAWQILDEIDRLAVEKFQASQRVLLRSGATSIAHFFKDIETETCLLAESQALNSGDIDQAEKGLVHFTGHLRNRIGAVSGVAVVDKSGKVIVGVDIEGNVRERFSQEINVKDRDYFIWAKQQVNSRSTYIIKPIFARGGDYAGELVSGVVVPLFDDNKFNGLVIVSIPVERIAQEFIMPLVDMMTGDIFLIDEDGTILSTTRTELRGENFNDCLSGGAINQTGGKIQTVASLLGWGEGTFSYYCQHGHWDKNDELLAMYNVTQVGRENMVLLTNVPKREIEESLTPLRSSSLHVQYIGIAFVLLIITAGVFWSRANQRSAFVNGYREGSKNSPVKKKKTS